MKTTSLSQAKGNYKGIVLYLVSTTIAVANNIIIKEMFKISSISTFDFSCINAIVTTITFSIYGACNRSPIIAIPKPAFCTICMRSLTGCTNIIIFYICLQITPLSILSVLVNMRPLFIQMLSGCMLGEAITLIDFSGTVVSFIGVCIIMINGRGDNSNSNWGILIYVLPLITALFSSFLFIFTKKLTNLKVPSISTGIHVYMVIIMCHPVVSFILKQRIVYITNAVFSTHSVILIAISCLLNSSSFLLFLEAFKYEKAQRLGTISYISVVLYFITDIFFYHEKITVREVLGSVLIIASSLIVTLNPQRDALISPMKAVSK